MNRVIIFYAPDIPELKTASEKIKKAFSADDFDAVAKPAKESSILDLAASDIIVAGFADVQKGVHPDFAEINRALSGINLAGRIAALFTPDPANTMKQFKKSFADSDITMAEDPLVVGSREANAKQTTDWVKKIISLYKEGLHAREI
jgi:flavodoxin